MAADRTKQARVWEMTAGSLLLAALVVIAARTAYVWYLNERLAAALKQKDGRTVYALLRAGAANVRIKELAGTDRQALLLAIESDNPHFVALVLRRGGEVNAVTPGNRTPLIEAALSNRQPEIIRILGRAGAHLDAQDADGLTALHYAMGVGNRREPAATLLELGAIVDLPDRSGRTPLNVAAKLGCSEQVALLLDHGANPDLRNFAGNSPLDVALTTEAGPGPGAQQRRIIHLLKQRVSSERALATKPRR